MDEHRAEVVECVEQNQNAVIIGETGSGKTTRIPVFLLEEFPAAKIAITQPRRVAARSVARYVADRRGERVGGEVGYQVRFEDETTEGTRANFMTDGILLRKLQFDPLLKEYDIVMVDEAHERSLNIDFVLGLLKRVQAERKKHGLPELKVIATSATIEKEKFANYFGGSPVVEVPGRMHPVNVSYEREQVYDYPKTAAQKVKDIVASGAPGDVLIFMPGEEEIRRTIQEIEQLKLSGVDVMPLFGAMAPEDQDRIFERNAKRKIIVSTNIAETSVTIDGVRFVVDSGLIKQKEFNPNTGIEALLTKRHAKSGCEQRKGRAGRTAPGTCYRLYSESEYNGRDAYQTPEIARSNLDHVILAMKKIGIEDVRSFDFIDRPKEEAISQAIETLKMLGALDDQEKLTDVGRTMAELPLRPEIARMVIEAEKYHCTGKVCTIAAMMGEKSVFVRPKGKETEADSAHAGFTKGGSDFLKLLEVWTQWSQTGFDERWARDHYLNVRQLFEVREIRSQLMRELKRQDIAVDDKNGNDPVAIQKCIGSGLVQHLMAYSGRHSYDRAVRSGTSYAGGIYIHPSSAAFSEKPKLMIGADVVTTSKTFARRCQPIKPEWLPEIAPQLLQEGNKSVSYDAGTDTVQERVSYSLKGRYDTVAEGQREVSDAVVAAQEFARALTEGKVDLSCVKHNAEIVRVLTALRTRSGGMVSVPDSKAWYSEKSAGTKSKREATYIDAQMRMNVDDYCPPEKWQAIDEKYPEIIEVQGHALTVEYDYRPANPHGWSESEKQERYKATVVIPREILFELEYTDFPVIGESGRPQIQYRSGDTYSPTIDADLEKLKDTVDKKRIENAWYNFSRPEEIPVEAKVLEPLPSPASLGIQSMVYTKDWRGNDVLAYPGYAVHNAYNPTTGQYENTFAVTYYRSEKEAHDFNESAANSKKQHDAQEQRRRDRETLMAPAKEKYETLFPTMEQLYNTMSEFGLSSEEYYQLDAEWRQIRYALDSSDADPKKVIEVCDKINAALAKGNAERERRLTLVAEIQGKLEALREKIGAVTRDNYMRYGLSYDQYTKMSSNWREANDALKAEDYYGRRRLPDTEKAQTLLAELEVMTPTEQLPTPEQEALIQMLTSGDSRFAQLVRVEGGRVMGYVSPMSPDSMTAAPTEIPIGKSGRTLKVRGNRVTFFYGTGNEGDTWQLTDGDYVFARDASRVVRVEQTQGARQGLKAIDFVDPMPADVRDTDTTSTYYDDSARTSSGGFGGLGSMLKKTFGRKEEPKPEPKPAPRVEVKPVEKEKMTEELRLSLVVELGNARVYLDTVRAVPEPNKKAANAEKISKARQKAADAKRDLNAIDEETKTNDDAARARGRVYDILRRSEKIAEEMARLKGEREDWTGRYTGNMARLAELAKAQDVTIDEAFIAKARPKIIEVSKKKNDPADVDAEIEGIIIDSL